MTADYNYAVMTERMPYPFTCCAMEPARETYMTSACMANVESPTYLSSTSCCSYFNQPHPNYVPVRPGRCNSVGWDTCHHYSGYPEMGGLQPPLVPSSLYPIASHTSSTAPVRLPPPTPPYTMATSTGQQIVSSPTFSNGPPSAGLLRDDQLSSDQKLQEDKVKLEEFNSYKTPEGVQPPDYRLRLKHRLPRRDRLNFTDLQLMRLEESFSEKKYIVGADRKSLADELGISEIQVKNWYQNRRTRWKRERKPQKQFD